MRVMYGGGGDMGGGIGERDRNTLRTIYARPIGAHVTGARYYDAPN
ncbi:MAG: hypothetical protein ABFS46_07840 [Myxococcota bacterium]